MDKVNDTYYVYTDINSGFSPNIPIQMSGYPFYKANKPVYNGDGIKSIPCGFSADEIYFLGLINSEDVGALFIGDKIGEISIVYGDLDEVAIPLIIGFTAWYYKPWVPTAIPFCGDGNPAGAREKLTDCIYINGLGLDELDPKQFESYYLAFRPEENKTISEIKIRDDASVTGYPIISGITVKNPSKSARLTYVEHGDCIDIKLLDVSILNDTRAINSRIRALQNTLYAFEDNLKAKYDIDIPEGYCGPEIYFHGNKYADMLTNEYFHCMGDSILPDWGSKSRIGNKPLGGYTNNMRTYYTDGAYVGGIGNYDPRDQSGGLGWSRDLGRLIEERIKAGYLEMAGKGINFYDAVLYGCEAQGFKPEPLPHWVMAYSLDENDNAVVIAGNENSACSVVTKKSFKMKGNMENDGHCLIILARYIYWKHMRKDAAWLEETWESTAAAAEWICWLLDNPVDPAKSYPNGNFRKDIVLPENCVWAENESVMHGGTDVFNNYLCYLALLASADMAKEKKDLAIYARWISYADRIQNGILGEYPYNGFIVKDEKYGEIWHTGNTYWAGYEALVPIFGQVERCGLDISDMDKRMLSITRNTYKKFINSGPDGGKNYCNTMWWAYGQSFLIETAILLDEMEDVTHLAENIARYIYSPFYHPWVASEGTIVHKSGKYWRKSNWLGNEVQIASVIRDIRHIIGVDDYTDSLKIIPRLPISWDGYSVDKYPVITENGLNRIKFEYKKYDVCNYSICKFHAYDNAISAINFRFGPFPLNAKQANIEIMLGNTRFIFDFIGADDPRHSGDSTWAWVNASNNPQLREITDIDELKAVYSSVKD